MTEPTEKPPSWAGDLAAAETSYHGRKPTYSRDRLTKVRDMFAGTGSPRLPTVPWEGRGEYLRSMLRLHARHPVPGGRDGHFGQQPDLAYEAHNHLR
jgi:hypothetical protein